MNSIIKRFFYLIPIFILVSCESTNDQSKTTQYFDTSEFYNHLINQLGQENPKVLKSWSFNNENETKEISDIEWDKEFKVFKDFDINKSSFITSYDSTLTENSVTYQLKPEENLPIKKIHIEFDPAGKPKKVSGYRESTNMFFTTSSFNELKMSGDRLLEYSILSTQKLLWLKPDTSKVAGSLLVE